MKKKRIEVLKTKNGSENGTVVKKFVKGQVLMVAAPLADVFIKEKWAKDMETPEGIEAERVAKVTELSEELEGVIADCLIVGSDSVQLQEKIDILKEYPVTEELFKEKFKDTEKIKAAGIKDAEKSLKALNASNAKKDKKDK